MTLILRSRSPHGERGLKFVPDGTEDRYAASLPSRGAWIEIWLWMAA